MKVEVSVSEFSEAFAIAAQVAPPRSPKEILQNVRVTADNHRLLLEATDLELSIRVSMDSGYSVLEPGGVLLPARWFASLLRECTDELLTLELDGSNLRVTGNSSKFKLPSSDYKAFPSAQEFKAESFFQTTANVLSSAIRRTAFATDSESSRFALGGVLLEPMADAANMVGTDGRRLAHVSFAVEPVGEPGNVSQTIIPTKSAQIIARTIGARDEPVDIAFHSNHVNVRTGRYEIYARLVEGRYPEWKKVIPTFDPVAETLLPVGSLGSVIRQAAIVSDRESRGIHFALTDGQLVLEASTAEIGDSIVRIPAVFDGAGAKSKLDNTYVLDFCKAVDSESEVTLSLNGNGPAKLQCGDDYTYVVMPMAT